MPTALPASLEDVQQAAARLCGHIVTTPLLEAPLLNERLGFRLLLKAECLQLTGSFKARGAFNQVLQLNEEDRSKGIIAFSSGNHAQGVAFAAAKMGVKATILMPHDAPRIKMDNTRRYGAEIVTYNRETEDRYVVGDRLVSERGGRLVHSYSDPRTIAGQGSAGIEIFEQTTERGLLPDAIIVNCCGGGLASGIALTRDLYSTPPTLFTAEPEEFDDARRSLAGGTLVSNDKVSGSICDALLMPSMGENNFAILRHHKARGLTATDAQAEAAMAVAAEHFKLILEPGGAVGLATACRNAGQFRGQTVVVVASGGNADPEKYIEMVRRGQAARPRLFPQPG